MCATIGCEHAFPFPTYTTIVNSQPRTEDWLSKVFPRYHKTYPWESKIRKVVWRGSLSESDPKKVFGSQRWRLAKKVFQSERKELYDIGLVSIPEFLTAQMDIDESEVGGLVEGIKPQEDFQRYLAVLDLDGNSWSSRFGSMLCYNSVIVKVEPAYVDHFHASLTPWQHYVPVKDDLSDLEDAISFLVDPANEHVTRSIVANANQWCAQNLVTTALASDVLDIFDDYVKLLGVSSEDWSRRWENEKQDLMSIVEYQQV